MKTLLIGGCSFSASTQNIPNAKWIPWTDLLAADYYDQILVINRAKNSYGQGNIAESVIAELIENDFQVDHAFVQWSAIARGWADTVERFVARIFEKDSLEFGPHQHQFNNNGLKFPAVSNIVNTVADHFYQSSISQILLCKAFLEKYRIPYTMFWGWQQITPDLEYRLPKFLDLVYDTNFLQLVDDRNGGMSEFIVEEIGKKNGIIENDFHPSSKGQKLFYEKIIVPIIEKQILV